MALVDYNWNFAYLIIQLVGYYFENLIIDRTPSLALRTEVTELTTYSFKARNVSSHEWRQTSVTRRRFMWRHPVLVWVIS